MVYPVNFCVKGLRCETGLIHCISFYTLSLPSFPIKVTFVNVRNAFGSLQTPLEKEKEMKRHVWYLKAQLRNSVKHLIISLNFCMGVYIYI
jgi:hypothetical protein